uniref:Carboxylic ester hydrolase n=1 Tax=Cydia pomonella TaxID=82600 RepID=A0A0Y0BVU8_CYDPO|nr:antennal esterase CXE7 [Cydia pomonella]
MELHVRRALAVLAACCVMSASAQEPVWADTEAGRVCGGYEPNGDYAYFFAVPYAKQPVGELRFQELQRPDPWKECRPATEVGSICPQWDIFYGPIMNPRGQSEECIHANIYVPLKSLPSGARGENRPLLPVLVYVHGGGFGFGSGDPDAHGPQYLVRENVVVITFNYRIGAFGFLSLNSSSVPGNAGLRDIVTLLRWVQRNAVAFGGNPHDVTLAGQSAGAAAVHLLTLSQAAKGLFKRAISMSGAGTRNFFTTLPAYAQTVSELFLSFLGINSTDPEEVHQKLIVLPLEQIIEAQKQIQDYTGLLAFTPVVESKHPGVNIILDNDPEVLQAQGRGKDIPFIIGFTNAECETFRPRFEQIDIVEKIKNMPVLMLPPGVAYTTPPTELPSKIASIQKEYFSGSLDIDTFLSFCSDSYFIYPALKMAKTRAANKGAPVFLYRFAYNADNSVYKKALNLTYVGAGHSEDLTFVFRANHALGDTIESATDSDMITKMTAFFTNFMRHGKPTKNVEFNADSSMFTKMSKLFYASFLPYSKPMTNVNDWRPVSAAEGTDKYAPYNNIVNYEEPDPWPTYQRITKFFDSIYETS